EELQRKDERIAELTQALREARGQSTSQNDLAERDQRIAECVEEIDRLKIDLEQARQEASDLREALEQRPEADAGDANEMLAERDRQIAALMQQVESLNESLEVERSKPAPAGASAGPGSADIQKKAQRLKEVARHLQRRKARLARMKSLMRDAKPVTVGPNSKQGAAHHDHEQRAKQADQLRMQQESLREAMRCLVMSEKEMIRRWA